MPEKYLFKITSKMPSKCLVKSAKMPGKMPAKVSVKCLENKRKNVFKEA